MSASTAAEELAGLDRVLSRLATTEDGSLEKVASPIIDVAGRSI